MKLYTTIGYNNFERGGGVMLPDFNDKILDFRLHKSFEARAFHLMNTSILRNHVVGEWTNLEIEGIQPCLSIVDIREQLFHPDSVFNNKNSFNEFIEKIYTHQYKTERFHDKEENIALIARALICCTMHFYINYKIDSSCLEGFLSRLNDLKIFYKFGDNQIIKIFGRLTTDQAVGLSEFYHVDSNGIVTKPQTSNESFINRMNQETNWCCVTDYLYSGVNLLVKRIERKSQTIANQHVESIVLHCQPTTYLSRMALGITYLKQPFENELLINSHEFLHSYQSIYTQFQSTELEKQQELFQELTKATDSYDNAIDSINRYLNETTHFTTISIAGNIITSDDYVIAVRRGNNLESPNSYSCSVNGVVEAYHQDVILYEFSDPNDTPSIKLKNQPFHFENEFNREMTAELGITQSLSWVMQGVTLFQVPMLTDHFVPNNLIIDVIGRTHTPFTLEQVQSMQQDAIESKENETLFGYRLSLFANRREHFKNFMVQTMELVHNHKDLISFSFVTILFMLQIDIMTVKNFNLDNVKFEKDDISILFTIILLIITFINVRQEFEKRHCRIKKNISLNTLKKGTYVSTLILEKFKKGDGQRANIVFALLCELEVLYRKKL